MKKKLFFAFVLVVLFSSTFALALLSEVNIAGTEIESDEDSSIKTTDSNDVVSTTTTTVTDSTDTEKTKLDVSAEEPVHCTITPSKAYYPGIEGQMHYIDIEVIDSGQPVPNVSLIVLVQGTTTFYDGVTTGYNGHAQWHYGWTGGYGLDTITVSGTVSGQDFSCKARNEWIEPWCNLGPSVAVNPPGTSHTLYSLVTDGSPSGNPIEGARVVFSVSGVNNISEIIYTNESGWATFTYTDTSANGGTDYISAELINSPTSCGNAIKEWVFEEAPECTINPETAQNPAIPGETHTVTITVSQDGIPLEGVDFIFWIHPYFFDALETGENGQVTYTYPWTGGTPDYNYLEVIGNVNGQEFTCDAEKHWVVPDVQCNIVPYFSINPIGTEHTVMGTVTADGVPLQNQSVIFNVTGVNQQTNIYRFTDQNGQATYDYQSNGIFGFDLITLSGNYFGETFSCHALKLWNFFGSNTKSTI